MWKILWIFTSAATTYGASRPRPENHAMTLGSAVTWLCWLSEHRGGPGDSSSKPWPFVLATSLAHIFGCACASVCDANVIGRATLIIKDVRRITPPHEVIFGSFHLGA